MGVIVSQTLKEFQKELGSKNPTPGGGVMAALAGSFSASLIEMVCNLTLQKKGYEKVQKDIVRYHKQSLELNKKLSKLADEDKKAYDKVVAAYRIDKKNTSRNEEIKKALKYAIEVPLEVRNLSQKLEKLAFSLTKIGNKNAVSDAKTAVYLAQAAVKSALENIKINKKSLKKLS